MGPHRNATNAMGPAAAVAKAMSPTAAVTANSRVRFTRTPRADAVSSPSWNRARFSAWDNSTGPIRSRATTTGRTWFQSVPLRLPVNQRMASCRSQSGAWSRT